MDNVCHTLVGAAFGEAGLKRRTHLGQTTLLIASNLPDIDVLAFTTSTPAVALRRGWTHGVLADLFLPVILTGIILFVVRLRRRADIEVRPLWLLALSYLGIISHVLLDLLNNYGVRLLMPFERRWFYGDSVFIIDPWLWLVLGAGIWLTRRSGSPAPVRKSLALAAIYIAAMVISARAAREIVAGAWQSQHGSNPASLMVGPVPVNPFERTIIADAGDHYETGTFTWFPVHVAFDRDIVPKNDRDPRVRAALDAPGVRAFLVWSRFPFWTIEPGLNGTRVTVGDMRFAGQNPVRFTQTIVVPAQTNETRTLSSSHPRSPRRQSARRLNALPVGCAVPKPAERVQVLHVHRVWRDRSGPLPPLGLLGLDEHRQPCKTVVVQQSPERFETKAAVANVLVPVYPAAARLLGIVGVEHFDPIDPDESIERLKGLPIPGVAHDVVPGRDEMAGVQADSDPLGAIQMRDHRREMLEAMSERASLTGCVLQQHHRLGSRARLEGQPDRLRDQPQGAVFGSRRARARVNHDAEQPKRIGAIELVDERGKGLLAEHRERRCEVDQIAGVRDHGVQPRLVDTTPERFHFPRIERFAFPLTRVLAEDLKRFAAVDERAVHGLGHAAGYRHVSADSQHLCQGPTL
jgi:inner membrane protein